MPTAFSQPGGGWEDSTEEELQHAACISSMQPRDQDLPLLGILMRTECVVDILQEMLTGTGFQMEFLHQNNLVSSP